MNTKQIPTTINSDDWIIFEPLFVELLEKPINSTECLEKWLIDRSDLDAFFREAAANCYIETTRNTSNSESKRTYKNYLENIKPLYEKLSFLLNKKFVASEHFQKLDSQKYYVLKRGVSQEVHLFQEKNLSLKSKDSLIGQKYQEIVGSMSCSFQGKERPLPEMATYLEDNDRKTREDAWKQIWNRRSIDKEKINTLFDNAIKIRHEIAINAGYKNYLEYGFAMHHRFDYSPNECMKFHEAVEKHIMPIRKELDNQRKNMLGVENLRPWDLNVSPEGLSPLKPFKKDETNNMVNKTSKLFHELDSELGCLFDILKEGDNLDLETRPNKAPGGYMYVRPNSRMPFIFMNAAGMHSNLQTFIHEAGHAFHSLLAKDEPLIDYRESPIEFAEVASMGMELLAHPYFNHFYNSDDCIRARKDHLKTIVTTLPWIATIDAFQHWIYENPKHTQKERSNKWLYLNEKFGASVSYCGVEEIQEISWQRQLHLFCVPLYYIEYGIAQIGSLQLWLNSLKNEEEAIQNYKKSLTLGGSKPLPDLFKACGIEFSFSDKMIKPLGDAIRNELKLSS